MPRSVVIAGSVAQKPRHGGHTWVFLQYLLGFRRLGWDVLLVDRLDDESSVDAAGGAAAVENSFNLSFLRQTMSRFGLEGCWAVLHDDNRKVIGMSRTELLERVGRADLFLNVMGFVDDPELLRRARRKVFLDIDPGFGQMWRDLKLSDPFAGHDQFVTIGQNIG